MSEIEKGWALKMQHHKRVLTIRFGVSFSAKKICLNEIEKGLAFNMKHHKSVLTFKVWSFLFCIKNMRE